MSCQVGPAVGPETEKTGDVKAPANLHYRHRSSAEIIRHAVALYYVLSLGLRDVDFLLAERRSIISYETIRRWCRKLGQSFANSLRRHRPWTGDK